MARSRIVLPINRMAAKSHSGIFVKRSSDWHLHRPEQFPHRDDYYIFSFVVAGLNVSRVYLNEAVKAVTGVSAGEFIRSHAVLSAKRMLVHATSGISFRMGFDGSKFALS